MTNHDSNEQNSEAGSDWISGKKAARLLGLTWPGQFSNARRRLERKLDRDTKRLSTPPSAATDRARVILVVPEWGGVKWPGAEWKFRLSVCVTGGIVPPR